MRRAESGDLRRGERHRHPRTMAARRACSAFAAHLWGVWLSTLPLLGTAPPAMAAAEAPAAGAASSSAGSPPAPARLSYQRANVLDGKVGLGAMYMRADPWAITTGYGQFFWQTHWDGVGGSPFGLHIDLDARTLLFEPRDFRAVDRENAPVNASQADDPVANYYRRPAMFASGRSFDYTRIDELYLSYDTDAWGLGLGRMLIASAAQSQVDGAHLYLGLGALGRVGLFTGLKPNPWHPQVVGAATGGSFVAEGQVFTPYWGTLDIDVDYGFKSTGPFANELGAGVPWVQLASLRFFTSGLYTQLRSPTWSFDGALVADLFDWSVLDRVWGHVTGGVRVLPNLHVAYRGTLDVIGARPLMPRDLFLDVSWRRLGPLSLQATYYKINTFATAASYAVFFRPLEDPQKTLLNQNPWADSDPGAVATSQNLYAERLNHTRLFLVDRDRVRIELGLDLADTLQLYADAFGERRGDVAFEPQSDFGKAISAHMTGLQNLGALCAFAAGDPLATQGINPVVPVYADLCRVGATLGLRDPYLFGLGSFDIHGTVFDGYFQSTRRVSSHLGLALGDRLWWEMGGALERNHNHRVYVSYDPSSSFGSAQFLARATHTLQVDATLVWRLVGGFTVEASYFGFLEDLPFQGDTLDPPTGYPQPRPAASYTQTLYARTLYRF